MHQLIIGKDFFEVGSRLSLSVSEDQRCLAVNTSRKRTNLSCIPSLDLLQDMLARLRVMDKGISL